MINTTLNNKYIIITYNKKINKYIVYYEGDITVMYYKPITDQEKIKIEYAKRKRIREELINVLAHCLASVLNRC